MEELISKISSYNIFNNLLPGVLIAVIVSSSTSFNLILEENVLGFFAYYFYGIIVSRVGSLVIEELIDKKLKLIKKRPYDEYIQASKKDEDIKLLSEVNNTYRTLIAIPLLTLIALFVDFLVSKFSISNNALIITFSVLLIILFFFSYKKQTKYISSRITKANSIS
ncbi:MAG: hypothetical protein Q8K92_06110 [Leadbetterella sp.]|nr:hypothetical protein [Leadbetterella sp.]